MDGKHGFVSVGYLCVDKLYSVFAWGQAWQISSQITLVTSEDHPGSNRVCCLQKQHLPLRQTRALDSYKLLLSPSSLGSPKCRLLYMKTTPIIEQAKCLSPCWTLEHHSSLQSLSLARERAPFTLISKILSDLSVSITWWVRGSSAVKINLGSFTSAPLKPQVQWDLL